MDGTQSRNTGEIATDPNPTAMAVDRSPGGAIAHTQSAALSPPLDH
jgi:hypothetical protein